MNWRGVLSLIIACCACGGCELPKQEAVAAPEIRQMQVNGLRLTYEQAGRGQPVVFVHGAIADYRAWNAVRDAVAAHYRFIAPTSRYYGVGPWPDGGENFSAATHADDLVGFIRGLNAGPVHLVGWSRGAEIELIVAVQHPELVKSVFAYEPSLRTFVSDPIDLKAISADEQQAFGTAVATSARGDQEAALRPFIDGVNDMPGTFDGLPAQVRLVFTDNARTIPLQLAAPPPPVITCDQLGRIGAPVAIVRGTITRPLFRIAADTAHRCIPGSRLVLLENARHLAPVQQPAEFNAALLAFLSRER